MRLEAKIKMTELLPLKIFPITLICVDTTPCFCAILETEIKSFCDLLFYLNDTYPPKMGLLLKERIFS